MRHLQILLKLDPICSNALSQVPPPLLYHGYWKGECCVSRIYNLYIFSSSTNFFVINSFIESAPTWPNRQCHVSKLTAVFLAWVMNVLASPLFISTTYNWPKQVAVIILMPFFTVTNANLLLKDTFAPFSLSFDTEIRFDLRPGICSTLFKVIFFTSPSITDSNLTLPLPMIWNIESRPAPRPGVAWLNKVYVVNRALSVKQWSLAPESSNVSTKDLIC